MLKARSGVDVVHQTGGVNEAGAWRRREGSDDWSVDWIKSGYGKERHRLEVV